MVAKCYSSAVGDKGVGRLPPSILIRVNTGLHKRNEWLQAIPKTIHGKIKYGHLFPSCSQILYFSFSYLGKLAEFLSLFVENHLRRFEPNNHFPTGELLCLLLKFTSVQVCRLCCLSLFSMILVCFIFDLNFFTNT